ncbi:MAG: hypothetical protein QNJ70_00870 [Xenococcaceae cyanobacterium MO_207.B15]|nr:hypothetical protein [Xenococcaceae cyanobacterium MO_207.B15]MDJ0742340.1 hypothetical protein [Xenococcaceae cyanobacterium MO_167.B27]
MLQLVSYLDQGNESAIASLKILCACVLLGMIAWTVISALLDAIARAKRMHQIPCTKCCFFTNDHHLKCTIKPYIANTEQAIDCSDYFSD